MTDKLYNGFREGRAPGDHKPNNQVRGMTQETMTKEQILERNGLDFDAFQLENEYSAKAILKAMSEWEQQQLSAERERAGKLVEGINNCIKYLVDKEGMDDGNTIVEMMKQLLD